MKLSLIRASRMAVVAVVVVTGLVACSDDGDGAAVQPAAPQIDGGTNTPAPDASVGSDDASTDAAADVDADSGPPRVCSDDGFCHTALPAPEKLNAVWADGLGAAWAVADSGAVLRYDGATWVQHAKVTGVLWAVWGSGPTDLWIGGDAGLFHGTGASSASLVFADAGAPGDPSAPIRSIWGTGANDVWAAGGLQSSPNIGRVLHYAGGGDAGADPDGGSASGWSLTPAFTPPVDTTRIWGTPDGSVYVAGLRLDPITRNVGVAVLRRTPGSSTFDDVALPRDPKGGQSSAGALNKLYDASVSSDGTIFVLGRTGTSVAAYLYGTSVDGWVTVTWTFVPIGSVTAPTKNAIWGTAPSDVWLAGDYGRLGHWDGTAWMQARTTITKFPETTPLYGLWGRGGELWVVGDGIAMHRDAAKKSSRVSP